MKIKITQPGWANFTGDLGSVAFVDGVSVSDVGTADASFLAGIVSIENVDTGANPSASQRILDTYGAEAKVEVAVEPALPVVATALTRAELELIADEGGIKGIRAIGEPLGLRDNSISQLIDKILAHQDAEVAALVAATAALVVPEAVTTDAVAE